ncbi:hypothetical protein CEP51_008844 [Fusarium floridanum]|uniref:Uncharacterized protein n=1 Tax=Fusarium floridanum TaxID=1325733 RepID=A0A428RJK5_9HYPO|nr:hypothetical protein CEP51_008844 [Fusarium floridanum]
MTDNEILKALGIPPDLYNTSLRARTASDSRIVHRWTRQWPWQWAADFPPKNWTATMVRNLARLVGHVSTGPRGRESKYTLLDVKNFVRGQANQRWNVQLKPSDIHDALLAFGVITKRSKSVAEEELVSPRQADVDDEEEDECDVDESIDEGEQHNRAGEMEDGRDKKDGDQARTSSKANARPIPTLNGESSVLFHQKLARQTNSSPPEEVITLDQAETSPSDSPKKRARSEEAYLGPAIAALDRPAKRRHLNTDESNTDHDLSAPTVEDPAAPMTKEKDLATLDAVVKRRRTESILEYTTLKEKVDTFQNDLNTRKASLEAGKIIASKSRNEVATCENVYHDAFNNLQKLRRTIEHYEINKDLMETLDSETRIMIAKDHGRRLGEMKKELDTAETHLHEARRKVEVEREEVKKRIKDDEAKLVDMEAGLELAHTERDRWICMEHLAAMKADDLKKFVAGLEEEGLGTPKSLEKKNQPDGGIGNTDEFKVDPESSGSD